MLAKWHSRRDRAIASKQLACPLRLRWLGHSVDSAGIDRLGSLGYATSCDNPVAGNFGQWHQQNSPAKRTRVRQRQTWLVYRYVIVRSDLDMQSTVTVT